MALQKPYGGRSNLVFRTPGVWLPPITSKIVDQPPKSGLTTESGLELYRLMASLQEVYRNDLQFLLKLKNAVSILHNRIHDNLARTAIEHFKKKHPRWNFTYTNAGAAGIDIKGLDSKNRVKLVAEVKTTLPDSKGRIRGPQTRNLRNDLQRLQDYEGNVTRYLVLLSAGTVEAVRHQLETDRKFPAITIFNALDDDFREADPADEEIA